MRVIGKKNDRPGPVEWVRSERTADNLGIQKEEDELRLDSRIHIRYRIKRDKVL